MNYTLKDIAEMCGGTLHPQSDSGRVFTTVDSDSRKIKASTTLFAALRGDNFDGHSFVSALCKEGGALIDDPNYFCPNSILVESVKKALYTIAFRHRNEKLSGLKVLAVTGSVGKTTVKNMAALVMGAKYRVYKSAGNRNSLTGLPMEVLNIPTDTEWAVLEAGMSDPGEIAQISRLIKPNAAIITNIGHSHILAFGSREGICAEKLSIVDGMENSLLVMPNEPLIKNSTVCIDEAVYCGAQGCGCNACYKNVSEENGITEFTACYNDKETVIKLPASGIHNVQNALLCFTAGVRLGVEEEKAALALLDFVTEGNRQNIRQSNGIRVIADCYNASPESMAAALSVLKQSGGKRIAVLGDMLELGEHTEALHRGVGAVAAKSADIIICVGEAATYIADSALKNGFCAERLFTYPSSGYEDAAKQLVSLAGNGDTVLFKASNRTNIRKVMEVSGL